MKLGVFDSGIGGMAIASALSREFPGAEILTINDKKNLPYGNKSKDELIRLTNAAIQPLLSVSCDCIVIACNSATAAAIEWLRNTYPSQRFIGIEPMIKPAAEATRSGVIAVYATPATLSSNRYKSLLKRYASHIAVIEPDCSNWARMIEDNEINERQIAQVVDDCLRQGADVIVLGCTHYHWIKSLIVSHADGRATILEPSEAIGRRVRQLLAMSKPM